MKTLRHKSSDHDLCSWPLGCIQSHARPWDGLNVTERSDASRFITSSVYRVNKKLYCFAKQLAKMIKYTIDSYHLPLNWLEEAGGG